MPSGSRAGPKGCSGRVFYDGITSRRSYIDKFRVKVNCCTMINIDIENADTLKLPHAESRDDISDRHRPE